MNIRHSAIALLSVAGLGSLGFLISGCMGSMDMDMEYSITMPSPRHFHAFTTTDTLFFEVRNSEGEMKAGLTPIITWKMDSSSTKGATLAGEVVDRHDGVYFWRTTFNSGAGPHTLTFSFDVHGTKFTKDFSLTTTYAGGERIFCPDSANAQKSYQVRWNAKPGEFHGGDSVTFLVKLQRSTNTPVNTKEPWTNTFISLAPALLTPANSLPKIALGSAAGETLLTVEYDGVAQYTAKGILPKVTSDTPYWLHVTFKDECRTVDENGATDNNYKFTVMGESMSMPGH